MMNSRRNTARKIDTAELRALLQLRMLPRLTDIRINQLLGKHTAQEIVTAYTPVSERRVDLALRMIERDEVDVVTSRCAAYPDSLRLLGDERPPILFLRGRKELLQSPGIAVIGARDSTEYGDAVAELFAAELARKGLVIISGLARGIDAIAHQAAFAVGGSTIAVLGCGIDVHYPKSNYRLQDRIAHEGLLISEFAPGEGAHPHHFPQRNRIIALIGAGVLVVEAGPKSGTRKTVDVALDHDRTVFAVPGPIGRWESQGTNEIIRDGGHIVTTPQDVILGLPSTLQIPVMVHTVVEETPVVVASESARAVVATLGALPIHIDEIARRCKKSVPETLALLLELELEGHSTQHPGKRFSRTLRPQRGNVVP